MRISDKIGACVDKSIDLTSFIVEGVIGAEQIIATIKAFHEENPTKYVLWDFSATHVHHLQSFEIEHIANAVNKYAYSGRVVKTALVFSTDVDYGLGRMFEAFAQVEGFPNNIMSFQNIEEAREWLAAD